MEGPLEFSIVNLSDIDKIKNRLDSEFYQKKFLTLELKINKIGQSNLKTINAALNCSAFYPSITDSYNFNYEGVPFLRVNEIQNGLININDDTAFLPQSVLNLNKNTIAVAFPGDIIIAKGGNTLAKVGLVTNEYPYCALSRDIILVSTKNIVDCNKYYLWVFLHSKIGQALLWRTASQTGQPHLTLSSIEDIGFPRYSNEFEKIFEQLYKDSIALKAKSKVTYSKAENLLLESIGLKNFNLNTSLFNIKTYKDSFLKTGRFDAEYYQKKYEDITSNVLQNGCFKVSDCFDVLTNSSPSKYTTHGIKVIKTKQIRIPSVEITHIEDYTDEKCLLVEKDDLLFASMGVGSLGRVSYISDNIKDCTIDGTIRVLRIKKEFANKNLEIPTLLFLTSQYGQELIYKYVIGSTGIISISKENVENLIIPKVKPDIALRLSKLVNESQIMKKQSEKLLEVAKQTIEIAIEKSENEAKKFINKQIV